MEFMEKTQKQAVRPTEGPSAIGPYSPAVVIEGWVYTSGQVGFGADGQLVAGGIAEQTEQALRNVAAVLAEAGCSMADVVKTTVFLKDMDDFAAMNAVYAGHLAADGAVPPARSTVEVARLPRDARVEIDAIARRP